MADNSGKEHMSVVICGHVDSGKSTTTGHLLYALGGINERDLAKMKAEAATIGKDSFCFAFFMDKTKEERARGITIMCTLKDFYTTKYHYTIIDAPGHRDFMKNMISGASQADVAVLMVPSDGNFATALAKGDAKAGEVKGQTREHARLLNLLGVKQLVVAINKMDSDVSKYSEARYLECRDEIRNVLMRVGWRKDFVMESVPVLPISGWKGDNLFEKSTNMPWWNGVTVKAQDGSMVNVTTIHDALNEFTQPAIRSNDKPLRLPVNGVYNIKGVGNVVSGKVEQGVIKPGQDVVFLPTHTASLPCTGRVFTVEMHHTSIPVGECGFNIGMSIKGLNKDNMPKVGDIMVLKGDDTLKAPKRFTVDVQVLDHPGELKKGYAPIAHCRTAKAPCKLVEIKWKVGKETAGKKLENPISIKANEMARLVFEVDPKHPIIVDKFESTEVLARVAFMDGNQAVMLGRVVDIEA